MPCIYISKNFLVLSGCLPFLESRVWTSQSVMPSKSSCRGTQCTIVPGLKPQANNSKFEMTQTASCRKAEALVSTPGVYQTM